MPPSGPELLAGKEYRRLEPWRDGEEEEEKVRNDLGWLLWEGIHQPGDSGLPQGFKPGWYDPQLFREGQRFAQRHLASLFESQLLSFFLMFVSESGSKPLIATGRTDTPFGAFQRYLSTARRILSWYEDDPFDPESRSWKDLVAVRGMHRAVRRMCNTTPKEELAVKFTIGKTSTADPPGSLWCPMTPFLKREFQKAEVSHSAAMWYPDISKEGLFLSQFEMSVTQFSFCGLFLLHPDLFGAHYVTTRELEGLVHVWAILGHCLGVEDRFNWCKDGLEATRARSQAALDHCFKHWLTRLSPTWEHMSRCAFEGIKMYAPELGHIEPHFVYLFEDILNIPTALPKTLTWQQWFQLRVMRFTLQVLSRWFPSIMTYASTQLRRKLKMASQFSEVKLDELRHRKFSYV